MGKRPTCDTPGCGRAIPVGGEGHPEICPSCLAAQAMIRREVTLRESACEQKVVSANARAEAAERLVYSLLKAHYT